MESPLPVQDGFSIVTSMTKRVPNGVKLILQYLTHQLTNIFIQ